jgi:hypothetical protein
MPRTGALQHHVYGLTVLRDSTINYLTGLTYGNPGEALDQLTKRTGVTNAEGRGVKEGPRRTSPTTL